MTKQKTQLGPRVRDVVADDYRAFIDSVNEHYKGRLSDMAEEAFILQMGLYYATAPTTLLDDLEEERRERFSGYARQFKVKLIEVMSKAQARQSVNELGIGPEDEKADYPGLSQGTLGGGEEMFEGAAQELLNEEPDGSAPDREDMSEIHTELAELKKEIEELRAVASEDSRSVTET